MDRTELHRPLRLRLARQINRVLTWLTVKAPKPLHHWLIGDDYWKPRVCVWQEKTVCRLLGCDWEVLTPGPPYSMLLCSGCNETWTTDDYLIEDPATRHGRDYAAWAGADYLPLLEDRFEKYRADVNARLRPLVERVAKDPCEYFTQGNTCHGLDFLTFDQRCEPCRARDVLGLPEPAADHA